MPIRVIRLYSVCVCVCVWQTTEYRAPVEWFWKGNT